MAQKTYQRRYDLDWLRVLAFALLILFHTGMFFNTWDWHVKNPETSPVFEYVMRFLHVWRMPLLFFISGAAVWFAMEKYKPGRFVWERVKRLLLPLLFGMAVIVPPQVYCERVADGEAFGSVWGFYQTVLRFEPYPEGNFSWHHLWYLPYVLTFSVLLLPLFVWLKSPRGRRRLSWMTDWLSAGSRIALTLLPITAAEIGLRPFWPENYDNLVADWAQFAITLIVFIWGFTFASSTAIWRRLEGSRRYLLGVALVTTILQYLVWYGGLRSPVGGAIPYRILATANGWSCILTILAFGYRYLQFTGPRIRYANEAVYPFYIVHQTITVAVGYWMLSMQAPIAVKFVLLASATFLGSWILFEFPIKRLNLIRPLFGLKMRPRIKAPREVAVVGTIAYPASGSE
jgi:glucans biosynthesis protein C